MKTWFIFTVLIINQLVCSIPVQAHFGMVIPSENSISPKHRTLTLKASFSHPFAGQGMELVKPKSFGVRHGSKNTSLINSLQPEKVMGYKAWKSSFKIKRPGAYHFWMEPFPYWDSTENIFIIHYTKTVVGAFGSDQGWQQLTETPTEIRALSRPFGNYSGTSFTGQVLVKNQAEPFAEIEVEYYNQRGIYQTPTPYHETILLTADNNGIFHFTVPKAGWWGFAALSKADYQLKAPDGKMKDVELGAVIWVYFNDWKKSD